MGRKHQPSSCRADSSSALRDPVGWISKWYSQRLHFDRHTFAATSLVLGGHTDQNRAAMFGQVAMRRVPIAKAERRFQRHRKIVVAVLLVAADSHRFDCPIVRQQIVPSTSSKRFRQ